MPNTEVKLSGAENTWVATPREDREMPALSFNIPPVANAAGSFIYSSIAQSVERLTVNQDVTGSSPVGGATKTIGYSPVAFFRLLLILLTIKIKKDLPQSRSFLLLIHILLNLSHAVSHINHGQT